MPGFPNRRSSRRVGVRSVRLISGLMLFTYVGTHLLNHSIGNASLAWLERGLLMQKLVWQGWLGTTALYGALVTHFFLGLWALYERRSFFWTPSEVAQLVLGLCIPPLLASHLANTRIAFAEFGLNKGYAQLLYSLWIASPFFGRVQLVLLVVAWLHGCYGVYFWLRIKPLFEVWRSVLLSAAVLLPVLALLGYLQAGREVMRLAQDPAWLAAATQPATMGTAAQKTMAGRSAQRLPVVRWWRGAARASVTLGAINSRTLDRTRLCALPGRTKGLRAAWVFRARGQPYGRRPPCQHMRWTRKVHTLSRARPQRHAAACAR